METLICLQHDESCEGEVEQCIALDGDGNARYRSNGTFVMFPRCAKHYDEYVARAEALAERNRQREASLYCKHGTFVGDPYGPDYLCGRCESE